VIACVVVYTKFDCYWSILFERNEVSTDYVLWVHVFYVEFVFKIADLLSSVFYIFLFSDAIILSRLWCDNRQGLDC
jgi:hypothetical protein